MNSVRVLIACAGIAERWQNYLGIPKQLVPIEGEPLLHQTVRRLRERGVSDICILAHDERLKVPGCQFHSPSDSHWLLDTLLSTRHLWSERTVILLGDVWFSDAALSTILDDSSELVFFGRKSGSALTGCDWAEMFGLSFARASHRNLRDRLSEGVFLAELAVRGSSSRPPLGVLLAPPQRCRPISIARRLRCFSALVSARSGEIPGLASMPVSVRRNLKRRWPLLSRLKAAKTVRAVNHWLRFLAGAPVRSRTFFGRLWSLYALAAGHPLDTYYFEDVLFREIDDFTDDFDSAADYETWLKRRAATPAATGAG